MPMSVNDVTDMDHCLYRIISLRWVVTAVIISIVSSKWRWQRQSLHYTRPLQTAKHLVLSCLWCDFCNRRVYVYAVRHWNNSLCI